MVHSDVQKVKQARQKASMDGRVQEQKNITREGGSAERLPRRNIRALPKHEQMLLERAGVETN